MQEYLSKCLSLEQQLAESERKYEDRKQFCIFNDDRLEDLIKYALERIPNHTEIEYYKNFVKTGLYNFLNELL